MTTMRYLHCLAIVLLGCLVLDRPAEAAGPSARDLVSAEMVVEPRAIEPGSTVTVGIRLSTREHWHTYWRNPGDSGLATEVAWTLPEGFRAGPIQWPVPNRIPVGPLVNFGYEGDTTLLVDLAAPASLRPGASVELKAQVSFLVCERECIPGEASLAATVPVAAAGEGGRDPASAYVFDAARAALPIPSPWPATVTADADGVTLRLDAPGLKAGTITSASFFPADETAIEHAAPQVLAVDEMGLTLRMQPSALAPPGPRADLAGVLVLDETVAGGGVSRAAFQVGSAAAAPPPATTAPSPTAAPAADLSLGAVIGALGLAFAGGLVLNLMPCVFPVLSIKVLSLVRHAGGSRSAVRWNGIAYSAGVVASFVVLAAILFGLRAAGAEIGWGFQLQSPAVVLGLAFLLFAVGLGLSGLVEFGTGLAARAGSVGEGSGLSGSFATGILAALVATPCTAPFMGAAVGYAVTAPAAIGLAVFVALGFGMAAPFLLLTLWPSLLARLPRPGAWMEILKQVLAFPIYATVAWLMFVLSQQVGPTGLFASFLGLVLLGFALWCWRLSEGAERGGRWLGRGVAAAALAGVLAIGWTAASDRLTEGASRLAGGDGSVGAPERFTQARLDTLRAEGRPVFLNMTAAWCITCLVNERAVLSTSPVKAGFAGARIAYLKGDWTNQDPEITRLLERHGRSGVPLYVLYPPGGEPVVLPQILTEAVVLDGLSHLGSSRRADLRLPASQPGAIR